EWGAVTPLTARMRTGMRAAIFYSTKFNRANIEKRVEIEWWEHEGDRAICKSNRMACASRDENRQDSENASQVGWHVTNRRQSATKSAKHRKTNRWHSHNGEVGNRAYDSRNSNARRSGVVDYFLNKTFGSELKCNKRLFD